MSSYVTDVKFPAFFYKEMQPVWISHLVRMQGISAPDIKKSFNFCELGCGVGINLLVAAACHPDAHFYGIDLNLEHIEIARSAAESVGIKNVDFIYGEFSEVSEFSKSFDFIVTHGVWSWVAPEVREKILDFVDNQLKPCGVFYLHYMCHPGSTDLNVLQHILKLFSKQVPGTSAHKVKSGVQLLKELDRRGAFVDQPNVRRHLEQLSGRAANDLAHEFLTDYWFPQHSSDVHHQVGTREMSYVGSADVFNNIDVTLSIPRAMQPLILQTKIPEMSEAFKDVARNSRQRMDLFQRFPNALNPKEYAETCESIVIELLPGAPKPGPISFVTPIGTIDGPDFLCAPILQRLQTGPASLSELKQLPVFEEKFGLLLQTVQMMMMAEIVHPCKPVDDESRRNARALTQWFASNGIALKVLETCGSAVRRVLS